jgi:hypothetical protein
VTWSRASRLRAIHFFGLTLAQIHFLSKSKKYEQACIVMKSERQFNSFFTFLPAISRRPTNIVAFGQRLRASQGLRKRASFCISTNLPRKKLLSKKISWCW